MPLTTILTMRHDPVADVDDVALHVKRIETAFSDYYVVCSCGFLSLPYAWEPTAVSCPVEEAEAERVRNRARFRDRVMAHESREA